MAKARLTNDVNAMLLIEGLAHTGYVGVQILERHGNSRNWSFHNGVFSKRNGHGIPLRSRSGSAADFNSVGLEGTGTLCDCKMLLRGEPDEADTGIPRHHRDLQENLSFLGNGGGWRISCSICT